MIRLDSLLEVCYNSHKPTNDENDMKIVVNKNKYKIEKKAEAIIEYIEGVNKRIDRETEVRAMQQYAQRGIKILGITLRKERNPLITPMDEIFKYLHGKNVWIVSTSNRFYNEYERAKLLLEACKMIKNDDEICLEEQDIKLLKQFKEVL